MKIAILGLGTIGYGVYDLLKKHHPQIQVKKILDKDESKKEIVGDILVSSIEDILEDSSIEMIVETMGGSTFAYQCIKKAIQANKHVVTANKEVMALYMDELMKLKEEHHVCLSFEASVGGGVPIIKNLMDVVQSNEVTLIEGIMNGTTNFILSRLSEGMSFDDALTLAQQKGFAEIDATYDLEGLDMVRKISILAMIATNKIVHPQDVFHFGIRHCTLEDIHFVNQQGYQLKYIASYQANHISVEPTLVTSNQLFGFVPDEYNLIELYASNYGYLKFYGKGAGRYPTANAIVNDILDIKNHHYNYTFHSQGEFEFALDQQLYQFYLRFDDLSSLSKMKSIIEVEEGLQVLTKPVQRNEIDFSHVLFYAKTLPTH